MNHTHTGSDFDGRRPGRSVAVDVEVLAAGSAPKSKLPADFVLAARAGGRPGGGGVAPRGVAVGLGIGFAEGAAARGAGAVGRTAAGGVGRPGGVAVPVGRGGAGRFAAPGLGARIVLLVRVLSESVLPVSDTSDTDIASPASSGRITACRGAAGTWISPPQWGHLPRTPAYLSLTGKVF